MSWVSVSSSLIFLSAPSLIPSCLYLPSSGIKSVSTSAWLCFSFRFNQICVAKGGLEPQRFTCLCLPSAGRMFSHFLANLCLHPSCINCVNKNIFFTDLPQIVMLHWAHFRAMAGHVWVVGTVLAEVGVMYWGPGKDLYVGMNFRLRRVIYRGWWVFHGMSVDVAVLWTSGVQAYQEQRDLDNGLWMKCQGEKGGVKEESQHKEPNSGLNEVNRINLHGSHA